MLTFSERSITVHIERSKCGRCPTKACVSACAQFDRGVLRLKGELPSVEHLDAQEIKRTATECLACEHACRLRGLSAISIDVPTVGLADLSGGTTVRPPAESRGQDGHSG
jgi:hypothetical protein